MLQRTPTSHNNKNLFKKNLKRTQTTNVAEDVGEKEPSYTVGGKVN
jgi:hypothetical protein